MKIFFTATREGYAKYGKVYKRIVEELNKSGHTVIEDIIQNAESNKTYDDFEERYAKVKKWVNEADIVIAEISTPSIGVGYEVSFALAEKKQVLVLLNEDVEGDHAATLRGNPSRLITVEDYNESNLEDVLSSFIDGAKKNLDTKFILIIPSEIDRYLEWASNERRMHKAQIVRNAIEEYMEKDEEYDAS